MYVNPVLITFEILLTIVTPLLILYRTGPWPQRIVIPCMVVIPVLWYLTYAPLHELSHALGTYLVGGSVTEIKLIPAFWRGEFAGAWVKTDGLREPWQLFVMTVSPYVLGGLSIAVGYFTLGRGRLKDRPFELGVTFMLLCLRPAFDMLCETIGLALGFQGDLYHLALVMGYPVLGLSLAALLGLSLLTIARLLGMSANWHRPAPNSPLQPADIAARS